jgi:hypothetical protein
MLYTLLPSRLPIAMSRSRFRVDSTVVSRGTIRGFESGQHALQRSTASAVCRALQAGGVMLVDADRAAGPGVRLVGPVDAESANTIDDQGGD